MMPMILKKLESDPHAVEKIQNIYKTDVETFEEMMDFFVIENFPDAFENSNTSAIVLPIFIAAVLFGRDFYKGRLLSELLHSTRTKIAASRLIILHFACAFMQVCILIWALRRWVDWQAFPTETIVRNAVFSVLIMTSNTAFVALVFCLFRSAVKGSAAVSAGIILFMRLSTKLPVTPVRNAIAVNDEIWKVDFPTAQLFPLLVWALIYTAIFTALTFASLRRTEF